MEKTILDYVLLRGQIMAVEFPEKIEPKLLGISQVCELVNVKRATLYKLISSGAFAPLPVNLCRKVLYQRAEIENWLNAKCPHRRQWITMRGEKQ